MDRFFLVVVNIIKSILIELKKQQTLLTFYSKITNSISPCLMMKISLPLSLTTVPECVKVRMLGFGFAVLVFFVIPTTGCRNCRAAVILHFNYSPLATAGRIYWIWCLKNNPSCSGSSRYVSRRNLSKGIGNTVILLLFILEPKQGLKQKAVESLFSKIQSVSHD